MPAIIFVPAGPGGSPGAFGLSWSAAKSSSATSSLPWFQSSSMIRWKIALFSSGVVEPPVGSAGFAAGTGGGAAGAGAPGAGGWIWRHQPERVELLPAGDDLRPAEAEDRAARPGDLVAGRRDAVEVALVGPRQRARDEDVVALADDLVDLEPEVRERGQERHRQFLELGRTVEVLEARAAVAREVGGEQFVEEVVVALVRLVV